jgi:hypothetical protein
MAPTCGGKLKIVRGYLSLVCGSRQAQVSLAAARTTLLQALISTSYSLAYYATDQVAHPI